VGGIKMDKYKTAIGIGITAIYERQIFPFMLSSAFTARTAVHEKDQVDEVKKDLEISVALSVGFSLLLAYLLTDVYTAVFGIIFALLLYYIYVKRGELL